MNLFNLSLNLKGFPIQKAKRHLEAIQKKNDDEFYAYLEARKKAIVTYHLKHNSFYKSFAKKANPEDWNTIPVMTKNDLQQPLETLLSDDYSTNTIYIDKTSGASGQPFIFSKDKFTHALTWSVIMNRFSWFHLNFSTTKQARFYGIPLDRKGYYTEKLKDIERYYQQQMTEDIFFSDHETDFKTQLIELTHQALENIDEKCQKVIRCFYIEKMNMDEIAEKIGFASADVAKTSKSRCFKKLTEKVKELEKI